MLFSTHALTSRIDKIMAMGGNYLLNIGPKSDGSLSPTAMEKFDRVGNWYLRVKEALEDAQPCTELFQEQEDMLVTRKGNCLYLHFPTNPVYSGVVLNPIMTLPEEAILLNNQQPLTARIERLPRGRKEAILQLYGLPVDTLTGETYVIRLKFADLDAVIAEYKKVKEADGTAGNT